MKLPFFTKTEEETEVTYYLTLLLTDEKASAVILREEASQVKIIGRNEELLPQPLEELSLDELINSIDLTISKAEEVLPPSIETHKTVFGVKDAWIDKETQKIHKDYLAKLKKICNALDLEPMGFMVITEAISHFMQEEEGSPLSAIVAEVGKNGIMLTLFRGGKVMEVVSGEIIGSLPETVDKLLHHFTIAVLPARIILFDSKTSDKLSQSFVRHHWSKSLPFVHVPQVTALPEGFDAKAVAFGAMKQMGLTLDISSDLPPLVKKEETPSSKKEEESSLKEEPEKVSEKPEHVSKHDEKFITTENFGFVSDVVLAPEHHDAHHHAKHEGYHAHESAHEKHLEHQHHPLVQSKEEENYAPDKKRGVKKSFAFASMFSNIKLPHVSIPSFAGKQFIRPALILLGITILFGGIIYYYFYQVQAHVVVSVSPKMVDQEKTVTFSATSPSDFSDNTIAAKKVTETVTGSVSTSATGKKEVGEKAKGTVTIYNNDTSKTTLESGTEITSSNDISFVLEKEVSIASASGDVFSGTKPGTAEVSVVAKEIGTDANLPSGTKFSVANNNDLAAKNESAFSGGTKKEVTVVSKNDIAKLRSQLAKDLQDKGQEALAKNISSSETLLPFVSAGDLVKPKFDKQVDDEAKKVTLTAGVAFEGLAYDNEDITNYAKAVVKDEYAKDASFSDDDLKAEVSNIKQKGKDAVSGDVIIQAGLLPEIKPEDIVNQLHGKSLSGAQAFLTRLPQVTKSEITFSPNIFFLANLFPKLPNTITVEIRPE